MSAIFGFHSNKLEFENHERVIGRKSREVKQKNLLPILHNSHNMDFSLSLYALLMAICVQNK